MVSQGHTAGAGHGNRNLPISENFIGVFQQVKHFLSNVCIVTYVTGVKTLLYVI